ncbi:hypothetical protein DPX16_8504 [Anabarilius grahami]|uniref:Uncharacterized protein n=1 Tax=Anabarilius grahami TaxID=495550 RepID=A0A3N0Z3P3_ANAGA|nr:hypothetical protein DPX16_8504 [Anabarilius grahami]
MFSDSGKRTALATKSIQNHSQSEESVGGVSVSALHSQPNRSKITANQKRVWAEPLHKRTALTTKSIQNHSQSEESVGGVSGSALHSQPNRSKITANQKRVWVESLEAHCTRNQIDPKSQPIRRECGRSLSTSALHSQLNQCKITANKKTNQKSVWAESLHKRTALATESIQNHSQSEESVGGASPQAHCICNRINSKPQPIRRECGRSLSTSVLHSQPNQSKTTANQKSVWAESLHKRTALTTGSIQNHSQSEESVGGVSASALHSQPNRSKTTANQKSVWAESLCKHAALTTESIQKPQPIRRACGRSLSASMLHSQPNRSKTTANQKRVWAESLCKRTAFATESIQNHSQSEERVGGVSPQAYCICNRINPKPQPIRRECGRSLSTSVLHSQPNQSNITANQKRVWAEPLRKRTAFATGSIQNHSQSEESVRGVSLQACCTHNQINPKITDNQFKFKFNANSKGNI